MILELRRKLINWLVGEDISVIINAKVYDIVIEANENCLSRGNQIINHDRVLDAEFRVREELTKQGVRRSGKGFVLDPGLVCRANWL